MIRWQPSAVGFAVLALIASGCSSSGGPGTTIATDPITTLAPSTTVAATTQATTTTLPPVNELSAPIYRIFSRTPTDGLGDEVTVLLDPSSYDSLTDIDLYDIIFEVVELFPPVTTLHVVDSSAAATVVSDPDASEEQIDTVGANYLARLDEGFRITYLGPFASSGSAVLGS